MAHPLKHSIAHSITPGGSSNAGAELEKETMLVKRGALNTKPRESDRLMDQEVIEFLGLSRDSKTGAIEHSKMTTPVRPGLNTGGGGGGGEGGVGRAGGAGSTLGPLASPTSGQGPDNQPSSSSSSSSGALTSPTHASAAMTPFSKTVSTGTSSLTGRYSLGLPHSYTPSKQCRPLSPPSSPLPYTHYLPHTHSLSLSHTYSLSRKHILSLSPTLSHTHSLTFAFSVIPLHGPLHGHHHHQAPWACSQRSSKRTRCADRSVDPPTSGTIWSTTW